jgi:hypothetical protein
MIEPTKFPEPAGDLAPNERLRRPDYHRAPTDFGATGVFAPRWALLRDTHGRWFARYGYPGTLLGHRLGVEFTCTSHVADAILTDHHQIRAAYVEQLRLRGHRGDTLINATNAAFAVLAFGSGHLLGGGQGATGDPHDHCLIIPTDDGTYLVSGRAWSCVDPLVCEHVTSPNPR